MPRALLIVLLLAAPAAAQDRTVKGTVTDADGKPVAGVEVAHFWNVVGDAILPSEAATTAADGTFCLKAPGWMTEVGLLAFTPDRKQGAFALIDPKADTPAALKLGPTSIVSGHFDCPELGRRPAWTNVYIYAGKKNARPVQCTSEKADFRFPLPAGGCTFNGYGRDVVGMERPIIVADGKPLDLGTIELKATAIAKMVGKPPLPWQVKDARGLPKTVKLDDLKGKWVLLDFWGHWCGPCVQDLADLIDFYEMYAEHRDKFEIVALHDSSVPDFAAMDEKLVPIKKSLWGGRDLPFPILLDDDKKTATAYTVQSWPTTLLIDPDGNVVGEDRGHRQLESKLPPLPPGVKATRALDKMLAFGTDPIPLDAFAKFVGGQIGVEVKLDEAALTAKGIKPAATVPLKMSGAVSVRSWFDLALSGTGLIVKVADGKLLVTAGDPPPASRPQAECDKHLAEVLAKPLAFDLPATTLEGLCQFFEQKTRENFVLDPAARRADTLKPDTAVPAKKGGDKSLADELKALLDPLGLEAVARWEVIVVRPKKTA